MCKINPRIDFAFKKLFGSEENKDLLISLINSIVSKKDQVKDVILKNPYNFEDYKDGKLSILDIKAKGTNDVWFNVEMQIGTDFSFDKRSMYYWARLLCDQINNKGDLYKELQKTICINILNFNILEKMYEDEDKYHNRYKILNEDTNKSDGLHDLFEIHYIELKKFKKDYADLVTVLDRWLSFLTTAHELNKRKLPEKLKENNEISKAIVEVDRMFDEEEREIYIVRRDKTMDFESKLASALEEGMEKGIEQGIEEGIEQGIEQERIKQEEKQIKTVTNLLKFLDDEKIAESTGFSLEKIKQLRKENN